jgi:hypothetical protein
LIKEKTPPEGDGWFDRNQFHVLKAAVIAIFALVLMTGAYVSYQLFTLSDRTNEQGATITALSKNLDSSREQLKDNGITPTVPPAKTVVERIEGSPGAKGDTGASGVEGPPGPTGPPGSPGPSGPRGQKGDTGDTGQGGVPGAAGENGPSGAPGADGSDGSNGADGTSGKDGQTGPQGIQGPQGEPGPAGATGEQGPTGPPGPEGAQGPQGTLPGTMTINHSDGSTETCTLEGDSTYNCSGTGPEPEPTDTSSPTEQATASSYRHGNQQQPSEPARMSQVYAIVSDRKRTL